MTSRTSEELRDVWNQSLWQDPAIQAVTPNIFFFDPRKDSQFDISQLYWETIINFYTCKIRRESEEKLIGQRSYTFQVRAEYYLQQTDNSLDAEDLIIDRMELVDDLVRENLGKTWGGLVDFWQGGRLIDITKGEIDGRECLSAGYLYIAEKRL